MRRLGRKSRPKLGSPGSITLHSGDGGTMKEIEIGWG